ncbi:hypothetical protein EU545_05020 [Candidatus Thorarchaeota archaeon]|nr:MAG: hypothetical protein EU545_05020 [Candidatus Thorarchaeota archaeon]
MQFGEIFEGLGMVFGFIVAGIALVIGCCLVAGEISDASSAWNEASDREKKWSKICCGSCTLVLIVFFVLLYLWNAGS